MRSHDKNASRSCISAPATRRAPNEHPARTQKVRNKLPRNDEAYDLLVFLHLKNTTSRFAIAKPGDEHLASRNIVTWRTRVSLLFQPAQEFSGQPQPLGEQILALPDPDPEISIEPKR